MMIRAVQPKKEPIVILINALQDTGMSLITIGGYREPLRDGEQHGTFWEKWVIKRARDEINIALGAIDAYEVVEAKMAAERAKLAS